MNTNELPTRYRAARDLRVGDVTDDFLAVLEVRRTHRTTGPSVVVECRGADRVATRIYGEADQVRVLRVPDAGPQQVVVNAIDVYDVVHVLHAFGIYDLSQAIRLQSALDDLGGDW